MCVNIEVTLPTIETFLLLYSLHCGCIVILVWTSLRALFCMLFFLVALQEVGAGRDTPFGALLVHSKSPVTNDSFSFVFYSLVALLLAEAFLLVYTVYLGYGIFLQKSHLLKHYLICRAITWGVEALFLLILCLKHKLLIGWYLGILLFVFLEFYAFIVVYSYYVNLLDSERCGIKLNAGTSLSLTSFSLYKVVTYVDNNMNETSPEHQQEAQVAVGLYVSHAYFLLVFLYYFVISLLLVVGVHTNKPRLMRAYYYTAAVLLVFEMMQVVLSTVFLNFATAIYLLGWSLITFYCMIVVRSVYLQIEEEQTKPRVMEMQNLYITQRAPLVA